MSYDGQRKVLIKYNGIKILHEEERVEIPIKQVLKKSGWAAFTPYSQKIWGKYLHLDGTGFEEIFGKMGNFLCLLLTDS